MLVDEAHTLPHRSPLIWTIEWKFCMDVGEQCGRLSLGDDGGGQVVVGKWVNFTFVDLDAHGSADCLATFKLGHDNNHATRGPVSQQKDIKQETNKKKKAKKQKNRNQSNVPLSQRKV